MGSCRILLASRMRRIKTRRVGGDVIVDHSPPIMAQDHETVEHPKGDVGHGEEVNGDQVRKVVCQERPPGLRRRLTGAHQVLCHGPFGDLIT